MWSLVFYISFAVSHFCSGENVNGLTKHYGTVHLRILNAILTVF